jgi:uncharacterized protein YecE (DUF72 family)
MGKIYIGTSGWAYKSWEDGFYPKKLSPRDHLQFYAAQFSTVEINATFYRLPGLKRVRGWRNKVPEGFVFSVKGSRYITHTKKLTELGGALDKYFARIKPLQSRTGPILWQLPPFLRRSPVRLEQFLSRLPGSYCHAVEFRHPSWLDEEVFGILRHHNVAHVSVSSVRMPMNLTVTAGFVYIRFHGLMDGAAHNYSRKELEPWAGHIRRQSRSGKNVFAYFNNDANARAPHNARTLMEMTGRDVVRPVAAMRRAA